jgi:hypothetical protein
VIELLRRPGPVLRYGADAAGSIATIVGARVLRRHLTVPWTARKGRRDRIFARYPIWPQLLNLILIQARRDQVAIP